MIPVLFNYPRTLVKLGVKTDVSLDFIKSVNSNLRCFTLTGTDADGRLQKIYLSIWIRSTFLLSMVPAPILNLF